jgi:catechol 2,3-dioxygenase-like lactoylglutathione lyase family enzyme
MKLIAGIDHHINLLIDDRADALEKALAFYQDLLGLEVLERSLRLISPRA